MKEVPFNWKAQAEGRRIFASEILTAKYTGVDMCRSSFQSTEARTESVFSYARSGNLKSGWG